MLPRPGHREAESIQAEEGRLMGPIRGCMFATLFSLLLALGLALVGFVLVLAVTGGGAW